HFDGLYCCPCFDTPCALKSILEPPQEFAPRSPVVFPGILAIQDDRHDSIAASLHNGLRICNDVMQQMICSILRGHSRVHKSHEIRDGMIAEKQIHLGLTILVLVNRVKLFVSMAWQTSVPIA